MARITLDHIRHAYSPEAEARGDYALKEVHHEWEDGGAYALLGPSGCGKTTLLNIISGLIRPRAAASPSTASMSPTCRPRRATLPRSSSSRSSTTR